ncbi:hypothetical protein I310_01108 [Cryptococcus deuterogattii CA1014]|nr:hypothetical protein I310_01108 [Cryptococcus deuterogattii CA1014]
MSHLTSPYQRQLYRPDATASSSNVHHIHPPPYHPPTRHHRSPQQPPPTSYSPSQSSAQAALAAQTLRSRGDEYLLSLTTSVNNLQLHDGIKLSDRSSRVPDHFSRTHKAAPRPSPSSPNCNKQLPPLPLPDLVPPNHYKAGLPNVTASQGSFPFQNTPAEESLHTGLASGLAVLRNGSVPAVAERPTSNTYRNVDYNLNVIDKPVFTKIHPHTSHPVTASVNEKGKTTPHNKQDVTPESKSIQANHLFSTSEGARHDSIIDLTQVSDSSDSPPPGLAKENVTPRSSATPMKATSNLRRSFLTSPSPLSTSPTPRGSSNTPSTVSPSQPCKRLVKAKAPYLSTRDISVASLSLDGDGGDARSEKVMGRLYTASFGTTNANVIENDYGDQIDTQDLETNELSFYKVGRTDNVPRRIGQWTNRKLLVS